MKKLFTTMLIAATAAAASATDYTTTMKVNAGYNPVDKFDNTIVSIDENSNGTCKFTLKNITFNVYGQTSYVGNLVIDNVNLTSAGVYKLFSAEQQVELTPGDDESKTWIGPSSSALVEGGTPVYLTGEIRNGKLYANLVVDCCPALGKSLRISLGDDAYTIGQLPNYGFEAFHTATYKDKNSQEPDGWHSFMSATGSLVGFVSGTPHTDTSNEVRPGSNGTGSVLVYSSKIFGSIIANGTITTGQMSAGAMSADDAKNNAFLDFSNESKDAKGDPFYATVDALPDSISIWVKFVQGTPVKDYPYATASAVITDGTRYQDPEDKTATYKNVVAKAQNATIESLDGKWQSISVPFDYDKYKSNNAAANAILVTISTNATPGKGSDGDKLNVDDVELVYNTGLSSITVGGKDVEGFDTNKYYYENLTSEKTVSLDDIEVVKTGKGSKVMKFISRSDNNPNVATVTIAVVSADCKTVNRYTLKFKENTTGINGTVAAFDNNASAEKIYNLNGQRVSSMQNGKVYIVKMGDKTVKVVK